MVVGKVLSSFAGCAASRAAPTHPRAWCVVVVLVWLWARCCAVVQGVWLAVLRTHPPIRAQCVMVVLVWLWAR